ncbi:uncharacterized protein LOC144867018 isoform X2 [Branchiostoma floridae x Branchiostoma japonicum]
MKLRSTFQFLAVLVVLIVVNAQVTEDTTTTSPRCPCPFDYQKKDPLCCNLPSGDTVVTDKTLLCPACVGVNSREECLASPLEMCTDSTESYCATTTTKVPDLPEQWSNRCESKEACEKNKENNDNLCNLHSDAYTCVSCCDDNGCVGGGGGATTIRVSLVTLATVTFFTTMKNVFEL